MPLPPVDLALVAAIATAAAAVQGMTGFGFGLVAMGLVPLLLPMGEAVATVGIWGWVLNVLLVWRLRAHLSARRAAPLVAGSAVGIPLGVAFLRGADPTLVQATLGAVVTAYAGWALLGRPLPAAPPWMGVPAGVVGGALGGAFGTSGPPALLYVNSQGWSKDVATSTLQPYFLFTSTFALGGFWSAGFVTDRVVSTALPLFPLVLGGLWAGTRVYDRVPQERFRTLVLGLLLVLGVNFLVRALG